MIKLIQKINTNGKKLVSGDFRVSDQSFVGILGDKNKFYLLHGENEFLLDLQFKHPEVRFLTYDLFLIIDYGAFGGTNAVYKRNLLKSTIN